MHCFADVQTGRVESRYWGDLPAGGFFLHVLLKQTVGIYYSHPAAWSEIGFGGPASPRGYVRLGFNERDPWEAELSVSCERGVMTRMEHPAAARRPRA